MLVVESARAGERRDNEAPSIIPWMTVCIPTYNRPEFLDRAIESVLAGERLPERLIVVCREGDGPSIAVVERKRAGAPITVDLVRIVEPGFLPPIEAAIRAVSTDVLTFLDDDAEATPDWLARLSAHYSDPIVGGVGGRYINVFDGIVQSYERARVCGKLYFDGRSVGNLYKEPVSPGPRDVDFLMGGNMGFRVDLLRRVGIDRALSRNVAFHWEMDVGLSIKRLGYRIVFDPDAAVYHHTAHRDVAGMRYPNREGMYYSNFNYSYIIGKYLTLLGIILFIFENIFVGSTTAPGMLSVAIGALSPNRRKWLRFFWPALAGRIAGLRAGLGARGA